MIFCKFPSFSGGFRWARGGAPGYRSRADGVQRGIGSEGTVWSASVHDGSTDAWRLLFSAVNMNPSDATYRGHGFQLRCLSE